MLSSTPCGAAVVVVMVASILCGVAVGVAMVSSTPCGVVVVLVFNGGGNGRKATLSCRRFGCQTYFNIIQDLRFRVQGDPKMRVF